MVHKPPVGDDYRGGSGILKYSDIGLKPTLHDIVTQMIVTSDNPATDIMVAKVGGRDKGKIALTSAGSIVLEAMNGVSTTLTNGLSRLGHSQHDSIVVSCAPSLAMEWLMPHLQEFYREYPDVELTVRSEMSLPTAEWMKAAGVDVVITHNRARPANLIELNNKGYDLELSYKMSFLAGQLTTRALANYVGTLSVDNGIITVEGAGYLGVQAPFLVPKWRGSMTVSYESDVLGADLRARYLDGGGYAPPNVLANIGNNHIASRTYVDSGAARLPADNGRCPA